MPSLTVCPGQGDTNTAVQNKRRRVAGAAAGSVTAEAAVSGATAGSVGASEGIATCSFVGTVFPL